MTDLYTPFLEATRNVFHLMLDISNISDQPAEWFGNEEELDVSIGFIGDLKGEVIYRLPHQTSLGIVTIMSGMEFDTVDEFVTSAISEIANIISGNVLTMLTEKDLICDILPPAIKNQDGGEDYEFRTNILINSEVGEVCLDIRLEPAK